MKTALIIILLLLTSGAFINLIVDDNINTNAVTSGDEHAQLMWGVVDLSVALVCVFHGRRFVRVASRQPLIVAFIAWVTMSVAWSDYPELSMRRVVGLIATTAAGFFLGMSLDLRALLRLVAGALALTIPASFVAAIVFPSFGIMNRLDAVGWRGVYNHKNGLGESMAIAVITFVCLIWEDPKNRRLWQLLLLPALVLMAFSRSMTAVVLTGVTLSIGFYKKWDLRPAHKVAFFAVALLVGVWACLLLRGHTDSVFALLGRDSTLTGRVPLWQNAILAIIERPWLGAGWDAFWPGPGGDKIREFVRWQAPHAHEGFLELALNVGVVGVALFAICLFNCFRLALRYSNDKSQPLRLWPLLFYTYIFLSAFVEAPSVDRHALTFILFCGVSVWMTERFRVARASSEEQYAPLAVPLDSRVLQESR